MKKTICLFVLLLAVIGCNKNVYNDYEPIISSSYDEDFIKILGQPNSNQEWGDWHLNIPDESEINDNIEFPSNEITNAVISEFSNKYNNNDKISIPSGYYIVKTLYKDTICYYAEPDWHGSWFHGYEKMSSISYYDGAKYKQIEKIDSLALIDIGEAFPQFSYFNDLFEGDYFDYRVIYRGGVYYVGFDFYADGYVESEGYNISKVYERDYKYFDWIIMLIPSSKSDYEQVYDTKRVMCEDLSVNHDFDFNDLVYDVSIVKVDGKLRTKVTVQTIGDEVQMSIDKQSANSLLGKSFYIERAINDIRDIEVAVFHNNKVYFLECKKGLPTQKICVSKDTKWCCEGIVISSAYPLFIEYVKNGTPWEKNKNDYLLFNESN